MVVKLMRGKVFVYFLIVLLSASFCLSGETDPVVSRETRHAEQLLESGNIDEAVPVIMALIKQNKVPAERLLPKLGARAAALATESVLTHDLERCQRYLKLAVSVAPDEPAVKAEKERITDAFEQWKKIKDIAERCRGLCREGNIPAAQRELSGCASLQSAPFKGGLAFKGDHPDYTSVNHLFNDTLKEYNRFMRDTWNRDKELLNSMDWNKRITLLRAALKKYTHTSVNEKKLKDALEHSESELQSQDRAWMAVTDLQSGVEKNTEPDYQQSMDQINIESNSFLLTMQWKKRLAFLEEALGKFKHTPDNKAKLLKEIEYTRTILAHQDKLWAVVVKTREALAGISSRDAKTVNRLAAGLKAVLPYFHASDPRYFEITELIRSLTGESTP